jgi:hypothetical protein
MDIVGVYAPANSYPEKAKDKFSETLKDVIEIRIDFISMQAWYKIIIYYLPKK